MSKSTKSKGSVISELAKFEAVLDKALVLAAKNPDALPGAHESEGNPITLGPRVPEAADWAGKMADKAEAAAEDWLAKVKTPKKNPIKAAIDAKGKHKAKTMEALEQDRFAKGLAQVDEDEMYATIEAGGAEVFRSGISRRRGKITKKIERLRPKVLALANSIDAMKQDTDAQREARMIAARRGMLKIGKDLRGIS